MHAYLFGKFVCRHAKSVSALALKREKSWQQMKLIEGDIMAIAQIREAYFDALDAIQEQETGGDVRMSAARLSPDFASQVDVEANMRKVATMEPVAELTGEEFPKGEKKLTEQVEEYFKSVGNLAEHPVLGAIVLDTKGIKSSLAHGIGRMKAAAFAAVPAVIENGEIIDIKYNWKDRGYDTVVIAAPINIGSNEYYEGVIVLKEENADRYYLHEVLAITKGAGSPFWTGDPSKRSAFPGGDSTPSLISILQKLVNINKNLAETNGENAPKL